MSKASAAVEEQRRPDVQRNFLDVMCEAIDTWKPTKKFVLFSGGNDSTGLLHRCMTFGMVDAAVHINTGIGIEKTREFVRQTCRDWDIPLIEKHPPRSYDDIVLERGFPGPGAHRFMYINLKQRCIEELIREQKKSWWDKILLITGVRLSESDRRMGHVEPIVQIGAQIWVAPLIDYTKSDLIDYRKYHGLPENEASALLHMSGECLCGAFAKPDEIKDLETFYPETARRIHDLEERARCAGQKHCVWGVRPSRRIPRTAPDAFGAVGAAGPLCTNCR